MRRLAFSVIVGNSDAHAKNYSVLLRPDAIALSPMYDVIPLFLYPDVDHALAMPIGRARHPQEVTPNHWALFARSIGEGEDEVLGIVTDIASAMGEHVDEVWDDLDDDQRTQARVVVARNVERTLTPR